MADIPYDASQGEDLYDATEDFSPMDGKFDHPTESPLFWDAKTAAKYRDFCEYIRQSTVIGNAKYINGSVIDTATAATGDVLQKQASGAYKSQPFEFSSINELTFNPQSPDPTPEEGKTYYSDEGKCLQFINDKTGSSLCIGREGWIRAENNTGAAITNGQIVYIDGADNGLPSVALAQANSYDKSRVIAMCTEASIADGTDGEFTRFGFVNGLNTSAYTVGTQLYLSPTVAGGYTDTKPTGSSFVASIGSVLIQHATTGRVDFTANIGHHAAEVNRISGYADRSAQTAAFVDGTRTLTITPDDTEYIFYQDGVQYRKTGDTYQIADTEGVHCIYYDAGSLTSIVNPNNRQIDVIIRTKVISQFVGWNATAKTSYYLGDEFHGAPNVSGMSAMTHAYLHFINGAKWISGGALNTMDTDGSGDDDTAAQFGIDTAGIVDEDLPFFPAGVSSVAQIPIWYLDGANANIRVATELSGGEYYRVLTDTTAGVGATGRLVYNQYTGGAWQLTVAADNDYVLCHIFACNDLTRPFIAIIGQETYASVGTAREGAEDEILNLTTGQLPTPEFVPFATVIYQTRNSYGNDVKARVRTTDTGAEYVDWRYSERTGGSGGGGSETFDGLADTPATKSGEELKVVRVNAAGTALEYTSKIAAYDADDDPAYVNNGPAEIYRYTQLQTAGSPRWEYGADSATEAGSDTGSDFFIHRRGDGGSSSTVMTISRATGNIACVGAVSSPNIDELSNPNLLINSNFEANQQAVSGSVVLSAGVYGHDGFYAGSGGCTYTFAKSNGVTTITVSAGTLIQATEAQAIVPGAHTASWTGTAQASLDGGTSAVSPVTETLTGGVSVDVEWGTGTISLVKLEKGSVSTPHTIDDNCFVESPQILKRFERTNAIDAYGPLVKGGKGATTTSATFSLAHARKIGSSWTVTKGGNLALYDYFGGTITAVTGIALQYRSDGETIIEATCASGVTVDKTYFLIANNDVTAYIDIDATGAI